MGGGEGQADARVDLERGKAVRRALLFLSLHPFSLKSFLRSLCRGQLLRYGLDAHLLFPELQRSNSSGACKSQKILSRTLLSSEAGPGEIRASRRATRVVPAYFPCDVDILSDMASTKRQRPNSSEAPIVIDLDSPPVATLALSRATAPPPAFGRARPDPGRDWLRGKTTELEQIINVRLEAASSHKDPAQLTRVSSPGFQEHLVAAGLILRFHADVARMCVYSSAPPEDGMLIQSDSEERQLR